MSESKQWIDKNGVIRTFKDETARNALSGKVDKVTGKGLSTDDFVASNYYERYASGSSKSTTTYSAGEIDTLVDAIPKYSVRVVNSLPTGLDISESTIYLVADSNPQSGNLYEEFVYVNNNWESLGKQNLVVDSTPTSGSTNLVSSGGVYTALQNVAVTTDAAPTSGSTNPVQSGGTKTYVDTAVGNVVATTTTDPGEGAAMTSQLLIVYEEEE